MLLGISFSHNSSAAFVDEEGNIIYAASLERTGIERYGYIKNAKGFPISTIKEGLVKCNIEAKEVKTVTWSSYESANLYNFLYSIVPIEYRNELKKDKKFGEIILCFEQIKSKEEVICFQSRFDEGKQLQIVEEIVCYLLKKIFGMDIENIKRVEHHLAHAYAAYATSYFNECDYVVTLDGYGDGISGRIYEVVGKKLNVIEKHNIYLNGSPCLMYQYTTGSVHIENGKKKLRMLEDEYKLLGMEVHAKRDNIVFFREIIYNYHNDDINTIRFRYDKRRDESEEEYLSRLYSIFNENISKIQNNHYSEFDVARAVQIRFEEVVVEWLNYAFQGKKIKVAFGGGAFYNIKLNSIIRNLDFITQYWIYPVCGDEGNSIGSALYYLFNNMQKKISKRKNDMYLGCQYSDTDINVAINQISNENIMELSFTKYEEIDLYQEIAIRLKHKEIVNFVDVYQNYEFGPRALMARSTLASASDLHMVNKINALFGRYGYMPFAPVIREENINKVIYGYDFLKDKYISKFMIMAFPCTEDFAKKYPATVHPYHEKDIACFGSNCSIRPQVLEKESNNRAWNILNKYEKISGEIALINTSFNPHRTPILNNPYQIINEWLCLNEKSALVMGNYLFEYGKNLKIANKVVRTWKSKKKSGQDAYETYRKKRIKV